MAALTAAHLDTRRDWRTAFDAIRKLLADGNDTAQVFRIMRALNAGSYKANYVRLIDTPAGGKIAFERTELLDRLSNPHYVASFAPGTVGAAYRDWLGETGYSADGLAAVSKPQDGSADAEDAGAHPFAWSARRVRDLHDLWHVLTGYKADEDFGEVCLVAFSYAQTGALGWAFIAAMAALKSQRQPFGREYAKAVWEAYRMGRRAKWLIGEDWEQVLAEPIDRARARLGLEIPVKYLAIRDTVNAARSSK